MVYSDRETASYNKSKRLSQAWDDKSQKENARIQREQIERRKQEEELRKETEARSLSIMYLSMPR